MSIVIALIDRELPCKGFKYWPMQDFLQIAFQHHGETQLHSFSAEQFWVEGKLPSPA